jgi:hypothetical protein
MSAKRNTSVLSTLTSVGSQSEADIVRAVLADAGIDSFVPGSNAAAMLPHIAVGLQTGGYKVLVPTARLEEAREVLMGLGRLPSLDAAARQGEPLPLAPDEPEESPCEACARNAAVSAAFTWLFFPAIAMVVYYVLRARAEARCAPPTDPPRYRRYLLWSVMAVVPALGWIIALASRWG